MCFIAPIQPTFWTTKVTANIVAIAWYLWGCFCPWAALRDKADALLSDMATSFLVFCSVFLCQRFFFFFLGYFNKWRFRRRLRALANQVFSLNENNRNGSKVFLILSIILFSPKVFQIACLGLRNSRIVSLCHRGRKADVVSIGVPRSRLEHRTNLNLMNFWKKIIQVHCLPQALIFSILSYPCFFLFFMLTIFCFYPLGGLEN